MVDKSNLLFNVNGVFNAIMVDGNSLGQAMFYGQGAGTLPTASAVCGDILEAAMSNPTENRTWTEASVEITPYDEIAADIVVRADVPAKVLGAAEDMVGIPTDTWSLQNWTVDDYNALFEKVKSGEVEIDNNSEMADPSTAGLENITFIK